MYCCYCCRLFLIGRGRICLFQRSAVCDATTYAGVSQLPLPRVLKGFLREYSYRHKIRSRQVDRASNASSSNANVADAEQAAQDAEN